MGILRHLQHWLIGRGPQLLTTEFVRFCRKVRFLGKIQNLGVRNSMTYRDTVATILKSL